MTSLKSILPFIKKAKQEGKAIVLATGVFDLLHIEHLNFLQKAKKAGDILIVGLESDTRVKIIKGEERPINNQIVRQKNISLLPYVDFCFILPDVFSSPEDHNRLIDAIKPNILAVSSHTKHLEAKNTILNKHGGKVQIVHDHNPNISTTQILIDQTKSSDLDIVSETI